jgi:CheY-like chemotaxis protein
VRAGRLEPGTPNRVRDLRPVTRLMHQDVEKELARREDEVASLNRERPRLIRVVLVELVDEQFQLAAHRCAVIKERRRIPAPAEVRAPASVAAAVAPGPAAPAPATVLLVEDEDAVRRLAARSLTRAGYHVLEAATPSAARALFEQHASEISLLLTDVVMPEMRGPALAELFLAIRPELPVVFMSEYAPLDGSEELAAQAPFLAKPFSTSTLLSTIGVEIEKTRQP